MDRHFRGAVFGPAPGDSVQRGVEFPGPQKFRPAVLRVLPRSLDLLDKSDPEVLGRQGSGARFPAPLPPPMTS
jgi:hypothetical protein